MTAQALPQSAARFAHTQRAEIGAAVSALLRIWRRMGGDWDAAWLRLGPQMLRVLDTAQERVTAGALAYVPAVLAETTEQVQRPAYVIDRRALVGVAGDGRPTEGLLFGAVTRAKERIVEGLTPAAALASGGKFLTLASATVLSDTSRTAERIGAHARHVTGYVRMLTPPSCGRCVQLAGQSSGKVAFLRHPGCDCHAIPTVEAVADDLTVDGATYLAELDDRGDEAGLVRVLGSQANVKAWRDGADFDQLINAFREKASAAQRFNGRIAYTFEGTTRYGHAGRAMNAAGLVGPGRTNVRLMPETIYARATGHEQAVQMLRDYGWITRPTGF